MRLRTIAIACLLATTVLALPALPLPGGDGTTLVSTAKANPLPDFGRLLPCRPLPDGGIGCRLP